ncbi:hypothetical protein CBR_g12661 [Chara braunii]|uniref:Integrase catalytic domain-containing protein n=1 Tax=Chara braunii TaxID=69332 RepID=A0A388KSC4_CHABU|nr:hypothetical protein CBR_g12661 [Chara braunii]|eukprot:GBG72939.1 hypothetical protein CBR_g12661 [Chara braunii]
MTVPALGMPGQLANESLADYKKQFPAQIALIEAEKQRQLAAAAAHLQAEEAAAAEKLRLQAEADTDNQARHNEARDLLQRHEATSIERLKQNQELQQLFQDLKQQHQELANLRRMVQSHEDAARALNARVLDLEQAVPGPDAGAFSSAPSSRQLEERVDHVVAMLGDISTFAAPTTISSQLDTLKTEIQQLQSTNTDGNNPKQYKMSTFQLDKFDDYTHQDSVLWADATHDVDVADLKDKITWEELTRLWKKRFIVDDAPALAINRLFTMSQGNTATRDWLTEWQKIAAVPDLDLPFTHLRREFYNRSCVALSEALGDREQYTIFAEIIEKAREIIKTNRSAAHEKSTSQPTYVEKVRTGPRQQQFAAVQSDSTVEDPAATQASREGDQVAAVQPRSNNKPRVNGKAKSASPAGNGQPAPPWVKFGLTEPEYKYRGRPHVVSDRSILEDGAVPPRGCIYRMSEEVLRAQLDDLLEKGWIRPSSSPYDAPVLFVWKKNKDLRLCMDYRKLNAQTIRNVGPLPRIDDLLERLGGAKFFSKLDLKSGYHQLEIRKEDRYKTAFKTRYGHFEWLVMPFGLTNAPTTFQAAMTTEFRHMLDRYVLIYLGDILVYSRSLEEHVEHLRTVLERLRQAKYKANRDKCEFARQELEYLGHYVTPQGIRPLANKIEALRRWQHFLLGRRRFTWVTDNNPLTYYKTQDMVSSTIGRWMYFIDQFDFTPKHLPNLSNRAADALSRRPDLCAMTHHAFTFDEELQRLFIRAYESDPDFATLYAQLSSDHPPASHYRIVDGDLLLHSKGKDLLYVPRDRRLRTRLLVEYHDSRLAGHFGVNRTIARLRQQFRWPDLITDVTRYCDSCEVCRRSKPRNRNPYGELRPMPIPRGPGLSIAMDVTSPFPRDRLGHDGNLAVVDRLSKYACFLPCKYYSMAPELAHLLHTGWICGHGVPEDIVSDRDTRFMSAFCTALMQESGTKMKPSSARHPQTDGQTERAHQTAQMMLHTLIRPDQKNWVDRLPDIELAYNTSVHPTIGVTPFELHHGGRKGRIFADLLLPRPADIYAACSPTSARKYRELLTQARANMQKAQVRMQQQANKRRVPCPIRAGDLVWVSAEEFALEHDVSRKLLPKWFGPWSVTSAAGDEPDGPSFVINIPEHLTVHPVFHASKLATYTPAKSDDFSGRRSQDPPSMDGHQEVNRVISDRKYRQAATVQSHIQSIRSRRHSVDFRSRFESIHTADLRSLRATTVC